MPFKALLKTLVDSVPGSEGAVFADWEGETVEFYTIADDPDHVKFVAAHHGILLDAVRRVGHTANLGEPQYFVINSEKTDYITTPIHDGYYLVLAVRAGIPLARANIAIATAVRNLRREMG